MDLTRKIAADIERVGWSCVMVAPVEGQDGVPFAYTVGLAEKGLPEIVILGLPPGACHPILSTLVGRLTRPDGRKAFEDGAMLDEVIANFPIAIREIDAERAAESHALAAKRRYGAAAPIVQAVWPDRTGRFPWDPGCSASCAASQCEIQDLKSAPSSPALRH